MEEKVDIAVDGLEVGMSVVVDMAVELEALGLSVRVVSACRPHFGK